MRIDLHTHTNVSDGTDSPQELVRNAVDAGLDVLALTDHDTFDGWARAGAEAARLGLTLVPGVEVSTSLWGWSVHLLAYLPDPEHPGLAAELAAVRDGRGGRLDVMVSRLRAAGLDITEEEVLAQAVDASSVGRPHVADVLVRRGYVADRNEAFARWLSEGRPGYVGRYQPSTRTAIELVRAAGGAPVLAHPGGRGSDEVLTDETIAGLRDAGLVGIEVDHQDHDPSQRARLRGLAADLSLVATGSSDYHGTGKDDHGLGVNTTDPEQYERLLAAAARIAAASGRTVPAVIGA